MLTIHTNGFVYFSQNDLISGLSSDLDTRTSGGIYYQNLNSQSKDFNSIKSGINRLNSAFDPTNLFRITFENVPLFGNNKMLASFQIILASSSSSSFVVLNYTSCLSNMILRTAPGIYFINNIPPPSQISNPCSSSNVNLPGMWVFDVSIQSGMSLILNYFS